MKVLLGENPGQKKIGPYAIKDVTATNTEHTGDLDTRTGIAVCDSTFQTLNNSC